ncbi:MAG: hypothetical protein Q8P53_01545 [Candidatus Shapirobacteria bacterium]|nr:hypothetical protein [Candidatus Shapirobacteria bacterium]
MILGNIKKIDFDYVSFDKKNKKNKLTIIPNVGGIAREMTGGSQIGIILKKFLSLTLKNKLTLCLNNISFLPQLAKMDYAVGVKLLCELEILKAKDVNVKKNKFILHNQMVDMALALNNKKVFINYFYLSKKYCFDPALITYNIGPLIKMLSSLPSISENLTIYTPINKDNYLMNPGLEDVSDYLNKSGINFINIYE